MQGKEFIEWLESVTGQPRRDIAGRLDVSPSLLTLVSKELRPVTIRLADKVADSLGLERSLVYEHAGLSFIPRSETVNSCCEDTIQLRMELAKLKNPRFALAYCLGERLDERTIEKLGRIIELELEYTGEGKT